MANIAIPKAAANKWIGGTPQPSQNFAVSAYSSTPQATPQAGSPVPTGSYQDLSATDQFKHFQANPDVGQQEIARATNQANIYKANGDMEKYGAAQDWLGKVNTVMAGVKPPSAPPTTLNAPTPRPMDDRYQKVTQEYDNTLGQLRNQMATPFRYDPNTDQQAQAYKKVYDNLAQEGSRNAMESMNERGLLNSSMTAGEVAAAQQDAGLQYGAKIADLGNQAYTRYQDNLANTGRLIGFLGQQQQQAQQGDQWNQTFDRGVVESDRTHDRQTNQDTFNNGLATRQDARAEGQMTGNYMPPGAKESINNILNLKRQAEQQGVSPEQMAQFKAAADAERAKLFQMGVDPNVVGFDANYDQAAQNAGKYRGIQTLQGQGQAFNQNLATRDQALQETQVNAQLTGKLPDGTPTYASGQDAMRNTAQYAGMYNGQPTMQKIMQDATIQNMTSDNLRQAEAEARATGNNQLAKRFEIWDRTGTAPDGIPGVAAGTPLGGKKSTAQTAETYGKVIDNVAQYTTEPRSGKKVLSNPQQVEDTIILSGLSDYEQYKLYKQHGLPWDDPIPQAPGK